MMEQIARRKEDEESVLAGIKRKMERIKMRQERLMNRSALLESDDHYQGMSYSGLSITGISIHCLHSIVLHLFLESTNFNMTSKS